MYGSMAPTGGGHGMARPASGGKNPFHAATWRFCGWGRSCFGADPMAYVSSRCAQGRHIPAEAKDLRGQLSR